MSLMGGSLSRLTSLRDMNSKARKFYKEYEENEKEKATL